MTAIKEYPFDFSDMRDREKKMSHDSNNFCPLTILTNPIGQEKRKVSNIERKISDKERKVSIMTNDNDSNSKDKDSEGRNGRVHQPEGPSRRKSNLHHHNVMGTDNDTSWDRHSHLEGRFKKYSTTSTIYSKKALSYQSDHIDDRSWWYACCAKCHQDDTTIPSWEPPYWQKICPHPFCPSFRQLARIVTICLIGLLVWMAAWIIIRKDAAPGGQLFSLALLTIAAHLGGLLLFKLTTLPALIGMLMVGILFKNLHWVDFNPEYQHVVAYLRKIALTILLIRAGMDLDPNAMKKHFLTVIKLSLIPWTFECVLSAVLLHYIFYLPWDWAFLAGTVVAAVSPAVIVACLMRLRKKGYGVNKGIPTLVLAVSGIDDAASVAGFGIVFTLMFSESSLVMSIIQGPLSVVVGVIFGIVLGYFLKYVPEKNDPFLVPLRVLFLLLGGIVSMLGFEEIGWGGAGPIAVIALAFVAMKNWGETGWELEDNPAVTSFEIFWMFFEPILFSVTGAQVVINDIPGNLVLLLSGILVACVILRAIVTSLCAVRSNLNLKEKIFVGLAWSAKATVQAALAPVALDEVIRQAGGGEPDKDSYGYAIIILNVCILSIVLTAPIGAIIIIMTGPKLLSRTTKPPILEGWRRSNRPSIRDISIINEEELAEREAEQIDHITDSPTPKETPSPTPAPVTTQPTHTS